MTNRLPSTAALALLLLSFAPVSPPAQDRQTACFINHTYTCASIPGQSPPPETATCRSMGEPTCDGWTYIQHPQHAYVTATEFFGLPTTVKYQVPCWLESVCEWDPGRDVCAIAFTVWAGGTYNCTRVANGQAECDGPSGGA